MAKPVVTHLVPLGDTLPALVIKFLWGAQSDWAGKKFRYLHGVALINEECFRFVLSHSQVGVSLSMASGTRSHPGLLYTRGESAWDLDMGTWVKGSRGLNFATSDDIAESRFEIPRAAKTEWINVWADHFENHCGIDVLSAFLIADALANKLWLLTDPDAWPQVRQYGEDDAREAMNFESREVKFSTPHVLRAVSSSYVTVARAIKNGPASPKSSTTWHRARLVRGSLSCEEGRVLYTMPTGVSVADVDVKSLPPNATVQLDIQRGDVEHEPKMPVVEWNVVQASEEYEHSLWDVLLNELYFGGVTYWPDEDVD